MIVLVAFLIYSSFMMIFSNGYIIGVNHNNRQQINQKLEKVGIEYQNITRLELDKILGDAELRAYRNFKLCDTKKVSEGSEIVWYILEEGSSIDIKYLLYILVAIILIATNKECLERLNNKNEV